MLFARVLFGLWAKERYDAQEHNLPPPTHYPTEPDAAFSAFSPCRTAIKKGGSKILVVEGNRIGAETSGGLVNIYITQYKYREYFHVRLNISVLVRHYVGSVLAVLAKSLVLELSTTNKE